MSKLQNIKVIREILNDEHHTQTKKQFVNNDVNIINRNEGDIFEEDGKSWIIKNGIKISNKKTGSWSDIYQFKNCNKEKCNKNQYNVTRYDMEYHKIHGCCVNCFTELQTKMILEGTWEEYEKNKHKQRQNDFL